ncbi:MAG: hypothetical protein AAGF81_16340, partial [Pseudomonadota bacterium]
VAEPDVTESALQAPPQEQKFDPFKLWTDQTGDEARPADVAPAAEAQPMVEVGAPQPPVAPAVPAPPALQPSAEPAGVAAEEEYVSVLADGQVVRPQYDGLQPAPEYEPAQPSASINELSPLPEPQAASEPASAPVPAAHVSVPGLAPQSLPAEDPFAGHVPQPQLQPQPQPPVPPAVPQSGQAPVNSGLPGQGMAPQGTEAGAPQSDEFVQKLNNAFGHIMKP